MHATDVPPFGEVFVRGALLAGDTAQIARNIIGSERLFRMSIVTDLATFIGGLVLTWALYVLLRPVDRSLALLAALLRLVEVAVRLGKARQYSRYATRKQAPPRPSARRAGPVDAVPSRGYLDRSRRNETWASFC